MALDAATVFLLDLVTFGTGPAVLQNLSQTKALTCCHFGRELFRVISKLP